jgi:hypothetical protein
MMSQAASSERHQVRPVTLTMDWHVARRVDGVAQAGRLRQVQDGRRSQ